MYNYELINGIADAATGTIYLMMALYMLLSHRSAFFENIDTDQDLRRLTGYNLLAWAALYFMEPTYNVIFGDEHTFFYHDIAQMTDLMAAVGVCHLLMRSVMIRKNFLLYYLLPSTFPILLSVIYCFTRSKYLLAASYYFWGIYIAVILGIIFYYQRLYIKRIKSEYSDITNKDHYWINWCIACFTGGNIFYAITFTCGKPAIAQITTYLFNFALWLIIFIYVDKSDKVLDFSNINREMDSDENKVETQENELQFNGKDSTRERIIAEMKQKCEVEQIYLMPELTLERLAAEIGTNRTYISRYLNDINMSYYQYINSFRIEKAKQLLTNNPNLSIAEISEQCGYRSDATFRRVFRDFTGMSPMEFKKNGNQ